MDAFGIDVFEGCKFIWLNAYVLKILVCETLALALVPERFDTR